MVALIGAARADETPRCTAERELVAGLCLEAVAIAEGFSTVRGGLHQRSTALGFAEAGLDGDWDRLAGLDGWRTRLSGLAVLGRAHGVTVTGSLGNISNVEALSTVRLFELWAERRWDRLGSLRFGQLAADEEFAVADSAANLVNNGFGWPLGFSEALPSTGPNYPLGAPGVRVALGETGERTGLRAAVFSGDPGGRRAPETDGERHNRFGTLFPFSGGVFVIVELDVGAPAPGDGDGPRPYVLELGGWWHSGRFDDQRRDAAGLLLADPASDGAARRRRGNHAVYAVADATLWRAGTGPGNTALSAFARGSITPGDRNLIASYVDTGLLITNPFERPGDTISLGLARAGAGRRARAADRDRRDAAPEAPTPVRDAEWVVEANWSVDVVPNRLAVQPVVQWVRHPGAGAGREQSDRRPRDALVLGLRARLEL